MQYLKWLDIEIIKAQKLCNQESKNSLMLTRVITLGEAKKQFLALDTSF